MDLKFTFSGASSDHHDHGDEGGAPSGIPLPFSTAPSSSSSILELRVSLKEREAIAEALSGDGVSYARAEVQFGGDDTSAMSKATRSAAARAVAELEPPLPDAVSALVFTLGDATDAVLAELGIPTGVGDVVVTESLQQRIGLNAGTPIRIGDA